MIQSSIKLLLLLCLCSCACQENTAPAKAPNDVPHTASPDKGTTAALQMDKLYHAAEQETIAYYQKKEQAINANNEKLTAVQFVSQLLQDTEEGVIRTIQDANAKVLGLEHGVQVVSVQEEKIPDDSIFGEIRFFKLRQQHSQWEIAEVSAVWSCYPGRGHRDYSTIPCN